MKPVKLMRYRGTSSVGARLISRLDFTSMPDGTVANDDTGKVWTFVPATGAVSISGGKLVTSGGGYITSPDADDWDFGADEFCMEAIVELTSKAERPVIGKWVNPGELSWLCGCGSGGADQAFYLTLTSGTTFPTGGTPALNTKYHMAWYHRAGGGFYMSLGGVVTSARSDGTIPNTTAPVTVGALNYTTDGLGMRLYQLLVRRGPGCAYPASNFTPPTSI